MHYSPAASVSPEFARAATSAFSPITPDVPATASMTLSLHQTFEGKYRKLCRRHQYRSDPFTEEASLLGADVAYRVRLRAGEAPRPVRLADLNADQHVSERPCPKLHVVNDARTLGRGRWLGYRQVLAVPVSSDGFAPALRQFLPWHRSPVRAGATGIPLSAPHPASPSLLRPSPRHMGPIGQVCLPRPPVGSA